jgi:FtsP/CotA-like multicopper oxidase with cupredoxin domain
MQMSSRLTAIARGASALLLLVVGVAAARRVQPPEPIATNDMRAPAGSLVNGILTLRLEVRAGAWYPDGPSGMMRPVAAFAEEGKGLQVPGPLVRVPAGTRVRITVRNGLDVPLQLFGLGARRGLAADSVLVAPGAAQEVGFDATTPGVYYYAGKTSPVPLLERGGLDSQLNGAIVVDPPGARPDDRLFLMSWWFGLDSTAVSGLAPGATIVINGLSWPHTERLHTSQGDELHWRWINLTDVPHPMHLHGFYFHVTGQGDGAAYRELPAAERQRAVTEVVNPGATMGMRWSPDRAGNWIFHCHFAGHMTSMDGLNKDRRHPDDMSTPHEPTGASLHDQHFMAGLVLGIEVARTRPPLAAAAAPRALRLFVRSKPQVYGPYAGYGYALGGSPEERDPRAFTIPGPTLVLRRNQPVAVTLINQSHDKAAVHWHGIELESFPDGVPGFSGSGTTLLPAIAPGDSLTVRFTPPRAGTFMYHSHFNEFQQLGSGMYGAIVVLDSGQTYDPETDRLLVVSDAGPIVNVIQGPFPPTLLNGSVTPPPLALRVGTRYRFRAINIRTDFPATLALLEGDTPVTWRTVARDGADLPAGQQTVGPATLAFAPGQIYDFEFTPSKPGDLVLKFGYPPLPFPVPATSTVAVTVR